MLNKLICGILLIAFALSQLGLGLPCNSILFASLVCLALNSIAFILRNCF